MTYNEFWLDNPFKVKYYKEAHKIKTEIKKYELWEQGAYFYESLCNTSVLFRDWAKKGSKPTPYPKEPYGIEESKKEKSEEELIQEAENERLRAEIHFKMLFNQIAERFKDKEGKN